MSAGATSSILPLAGRERAVGYLVLASWGHSHGLC